MKRLLTGLLCLLCQLGYGQLAPTVGFQQPEIKVPLPPSEEVTYPLALQQDSVYAFYVRERGVDVTVVLTDPRDHKVVEQDSIDNEWGLESFEFTPTTTGDYTLAIRRTEERSRPQVDSVELRVRQFTATELERRHEIAIELAPENRKVVQTLDIDHFWEAFDSLATATDRLDSIRIIQTVYLDRGTDGLEDFIIEREREFTAEKFVDEIAAQPKFFRSVRANTFKVKEAVPQLTAIVDTFRVLYPDFEPKKICFAIGIVNTGGTTSEDFLLIGTEISTSTIDVDLSEFAEGAFKDILADTTDVRQKINNIVAHEYVHTQQRWEADETAIGCNLLHAALIEGMCDFIGELISGDQINKVAKTYGDAHEQELWTAFKNELCNESAGNWLYNYGEVEDKPADLGYYIGYQISKAYYQQAADKEQAISDMLDLRDPIEFLQLSGYDRQEKE